MQFGSVHLVVAVVVLGGCLATPQQDEAGAPSGAGAETAPPAPLRFEGALQAVGMPDGSTTGCGPRGHGCASHSFSIEGPWQVTLRLVSSNGMVTGSTARVLWGSDYDLGLLDRAGRELATSARPDREPDVIEAQLEPGTYTAAVRAWNDQDGRYVLDIVFAPPESQ